MELSIPCFDFLYFFKLWEMTQFIQKCIFFHTLLLGWGSRQGMENSIQFRRFHYYIYIEEHPNLLEMLKCSLFRPSSLTIR